MSDIFLSYARTEIEKARKFNDILVARGYSVFFDTDKLDGGDIFPAVIDRELKSAKAVIALWSPYSLTRPWVLRECSIAAELDTLVPVEIEKLTVYSTPAQFYGTECVNLIDFDEPENHENWHRFERALKRRLTQDRPQEQSISDSSTFYLSPFPKDSASKAGSPKLETIEIPVKDDWYSRLPPQVRFILSPPLLIALIISELLLFDVYRSANDLLPNGATLSAMVRDCDAAENMLSCERVAKSYSTNLVTLQLIGQKAGSFDRNEAARYYLKACFFGADAVANDVILSSREIKIAGKSCAYAVDNAVFRGGAKIPLKDIVRATCLGAKTFQNSKAAEILNSPVGRLSIDCEKHFAPPELPAGTLK